MSFMLMLLQQLRTPPSLSEVRENILDIATELGFNARSWPATACNAHSWSFFVRVYAPLTDGIRKVAEGGYNGTWLKTRGCTSRATATTTTR